MKISQSKFRYDINALRCIAVTAVVLFHIFPSFFPSGFVGVDVFFVISGFLMTRIICGDLLAKDFSLRKFLLARFRRIVPALCVVIIACFVLGYFYLSQFRYLTLTDHAFSSIGFFSNIVFWTEAGYFDLSSHEKWLLHTWSLSLEWQFYIIFPILMIALFRVFPALSVEVLKLLFVILIFSSFSLSVLASARWPDAAFFLLPTRVWEFMVGGIASLGVANRLAGMAAVKLLGYALIIVSCFLFSPEVAWPGYSAIMPVLGAFLVIATNDQSAGYEKIVFVQSIGMWSYSIYLWHWPIFIWMTYFVLDIGFYSAILALLISLVVGWFSYITIERGGARLGVSLALCCVLIGVVSIHTDGFKGRIDKDLQYTGEEYKLFEYGGAGNAHPKHQPFFTGDHVDMIFFGDSYAHQYAHAFFNANISAVMYVDHGCAMLPGLTRFDKGHEDKRCSMGFQSIKELLKKYPKADLVYANFGDYRSSHRKADGISLSALDESQWSKLLSDSINELMQVAGSDRSLFLVGRTNGDKHQTAECLLLRQSASDKECLRNSPKKRDFINELFRLLAQQADRIEYVSPNEKLCDESQCLLTDGRYPIHSDAGHLSRYGSELVIPAFSSKLSTGT